MSRAAPRPAAPGFTLIELMIVVAIIGILAAVAVPKFADLVRKSKEGATKGNLGVVRSALSIYYSDAEGIYPQDNLGCLLPKYLDEIPDAKLSPYHVVSNEVTAGSSVTALDDGGGWAYDNVAGDMYWGYVVVNCTHTDSKGTIWYHY